MFAGLWPSAPRLVPQRDGGAFFLADQLVEILARLHEVGEFRARVFNGKRGGQVIRWMNVTRYLKARKDKKSRQIIFDGEKLDMEAVWKVRDGFFPPTGGNARKR